MLSLFRLYHCSRNKPVCFVVCVLDLYLIQNISPADLATLNYWPFHFELLTLPLWTIDRVTLTCLNGPSKRGLPLSLLLCKHWEFENLSISLRQISTQVVLDSADSGWVPYQWGNFLLATSWLELTGEGRALSFTAIYWDHALQLSAYALVPITTSVLFSPLFKCIFRPTSSW